MSFIYRIDEKELDLVRKELEYSPLNLMQIGRIFGHEFWSLLILVQTNVTIDVKENDVKIEIILPK